MRKKCVNLSELIVGLLLILLGIFTFVCPDSMLTGAIVIYGIIIIAMGVLDIVIYARLSLFTGFGPMLSLITGILSVMCAHRHSSAVVYIALYFGAIKNRSRAPFRKQTVLFIFADIKYFRTDDGYFYDIQPRSFVLDCQNRKLYGGGLHGHVRNRKRDRGVCAKKIKRVIAEAITLLLF